jgi:hypothetical protein
MPSLMKVIMRKRSSLGSVLKASVDRGRAGESSRDEVYFCIDLRGRCACGGGGRSRGILGSTLISICLRNGGILASRCCCYAWSIISSASLMLARFMGENDEVILCHFNSGFCERLTRMGENSGT